ncbi:MAG: DMT family transporter, partial [Rhodospirillaceae bacterium]
WKILYLVGVCVKPIGMVTPMSTHVPQFRREAEAVGFGIVYMLCGVFCLAVLNVLVKLLAARYSILEIAFFRCFFAIFPAVIMGMAAGGRHTLRTDRFGAHFSRACIGMTAMMLMFWSYHLLPLADAVAIGFSGPLFVTALSVPLLAESVGWFRWSAVALGFVGTLMMLNPSTAVFDRGAIVALASAVGYAFAVIAIRRLSSTERSTTIVFYFTLNSTLMLALPLPFFWTTPTPADFGMMLLIGLCGGLGQYFNTRALTLSPPAALGPFTYTSILWATAFGYLVWAELPDPALLPGAVIVIASGFILAWRETMKSQAPVAVTAFSANR